MNRFKELRLKHGFKTQQQLAAVLFVNQTAVSQWERGVTVPSAQILRKLSQIYGVSIDYLLGGPSSDIDKKIPATVSGDGQAEKLAQALQGIGIDVDSLSDAEINRIARLAKAALEE